MVSFHEAQNSKMGGTALGSTLFAAEPEFQSRAAKKKKFDEEARAKTPWRGVLCVFKGTSYFGGGTRTRKGKNAF